MKQPKNTPADIYQRRAEQPDFCGLGDIASSFVIFVVLLEDSGFWGKYDIRLIRSALKDALHGRSTRGYSTIKQQLAKNLYFTFERRVKRKLLELFYAADIEKHLAKRQTLELYINTIYFDNGQYGICQASRFYFHREPAELTVNQSFFLAALLPVVGNCNPLYHPEKYVKHRNRKLKNIGDLIPKETVEEILRHGPDCLDEELCRAVPETDRYNACPPMVNERFGPGGRESLTDTAAYGKKEGEGRNSPLVEYISLSPNHSGLRTHSIDRITPHCTGGQVTAEGLGRWFSVNSRRASSNYGIDRHGRVGMYVMEKNCSWCSSSPENDQRAVTVECSSDRSGACKMNGAVYRTLIRLCTDICRRNGKKKLLWLEDEDKTLHYTPAPDEMVLTVHRWFSGKSCPGEWLYSRLGDLAEKVTAALSDPDERKKSKTGIGTGLAAGIFSSDASVKRAKRLVSQMSVEEKIGQILLLDFRRWTSAEGEGPPEALTVLNDEIRGILQDYHCGNIILFDENCRDTKSLCRLTYELQQAATAGGGLPLLIGIDQEGGALTRLGSGTCLSGNMALGLSGEDANAYLSGQLIGSELKAVGINCDFAPVADVIGSAGHSAIGTRAFSDNAELTAKMAVAMSAGLLSQGVVSCAKHFPGHGDTGDDFHSVLPRINVTGKEWSRRDALPFRELIRSGIPMIMIGHLQIPALDGTQYKFSEKGAPIYVPASLSKRIITDILKRKMGFQGVVITDSLKMDCVSQYFKPRDAAVMALRAGADMLCMPVTLRSASDVRELETVYAMIKKATERGVVSQKRLDDAVTRVLTMKMRAGILDADYHYDAEAAAEAADAFVGGAEHRKTERRLADACIRLVYNGRFEPFRTNDEKRTVFFVPHKEAYFSVLHSVSRMERAGRKLNAEIFCYGEREKLTDEMTAGLTAADNLVVVSDGLTGAASEKASRMAEMPQKILSRASAEHIAVICIGLSGQAEEPDDRYPKLLVASRGGMDPEDVGRDRPRHRYDPAIPAAVYRIFGISEL